MRIPRGSVAFDELARAQDYEAEEDHVGRSGDGDPHADRYAGRVNHRQREIEQREQNCTRLGLEGHSGQGHAEATSRSSDRATPSAARGERSQIFVNIKTLFFSDFFAFLTFLSLIPRRLSAVIR